MEWSELKPPFSLELFFPWGWVTMWLELTTDALKITESISEAQHNFIKVVSVNTNNTFPSWVFYPHRSLNTSIKG